MNARTYEELDKMLCKELDAFAKEKSESKLETLHKLTDTLKNLHKIEMLEKRKAAIAMITVVQAIGRHAAMAEATAMMVAAVMPAVVASIM